MLYCLTKKLFCSRKLLLVRGRKKETTGLENLGMDWDEEDEVKRRTRAGPKKIQDISSDEEGIVASTSTSKKVGQKWVVSEFKIY